MTMMRFVPGPSKVEDNLTRLRRNSINLVPGDAADVTLTVASVRLGATVADGNKSLSTDVRLSFEKNRAALLVSVNPALLALLGYTPGVPTVVTEASWPAEGQELTVALSKKLSEAEAVAVNELDYVLDLHVVPVGLP